MNPFILMLILSTIWCWNPSTSMNDDASRTGVSMKSGEQNEVASRVYSWPESYSEHGKGVQVARVLQGNTTALRHLEVKVYSLSKKASHRVTSGQENETLVIVKQGAIAAFLGGTEKVLGPGSVVVLFPGDTLEIENNEEGNARYFVFDYQSRGGVDLARGKEAGGSFVIDWDELEMKKTDKGGRRNYFDQSTSALKRFEMHVTTLNEGLMSHGVHTHREEEFLLILENVVEEHIDGSVHEASEGDLIFLNSMVPHNITNIGTGQAVYFAFKWE